MRPCPGCRVRPLPWLAGEPAAVQAIAERGRSRHSSAPTSCSAARRPGSSLGRADLVGRCLQHPLARALRPGGLVLAALQRTRADLPRRTGGNRDPILEDGRNTVWRGLKNGRLAVVEAVVAVHPSARVEPTEALPGAGSAPGVTMPSVGVVIDGNLLEQLRRHETPVIARSRDDRTSLDFRSVDPADDVTIVAALRGGP